MQAEWGASENDCKAKTCGAAEAAPFQNSGFIRGSLVLKEED
jgi:hypothetical protein